MEPNRNDLNGRWDQEDPGTLPARTARAPREEWTVDLKTRRIVRGDRPGPSAARHGRRSTPREPQAHATNQPTAPGDRRGDLPLA